MATPKGMRTQRFVITSGDAVHKYNDGEKIILQLRHEVPTETGILAASFKTTVAIR